MEETALKRGQVDSALIDYEECQNIVVVHNIQPVNYMQLK